MTQQPENNDDSPDLNEQMKALQGEHDELLDSLPSDPGSYQEDEEKSRIQPLPIPEAEEEVGNEGIVDVPDTPTELSTPPTSSPAAGGAITQAAPLPEPPSAAPAGDTQAPLPIPERRTQGEESYDVDVDWTQQSAKGLDLTDAEAAVPVSEKEPSPSVAMDDIAPIMQEFVTQTVGLIRTMQDILLEGIADMEDIGSRFDRMR